MAASPLARARQRTRAYRQWRRARGGGNTPFQQPLAPPEHKVGPDVEFVYWHPQRHGVELAPQHIRDKLKVIHPTLSACLPPLQAPVPRHRWLIWASDPKSQNSYCPGWYLVFVWEHTRTKAFLKLEPFDWLAQNLYACMVSKQGGSRAYFDKIAADETKARFDREQAWTDLRQAKQREMLSMRRIRNIGPGNKFALHHDGTMVPSRGELNWLRERLEQRMPPEARQQIAQRREQLRNAGWIP